jgi:hypothetical protein
MFLGVVGTEAFLTARSNLSQRKTLIVLFDGVRCRT